MFIHRCGGAFNSIVLATGRPHFIVLATGRPEYFCTVIDFLIRHLNGTQKARVCCAVKHVCWICFFHQMQAIHSLSICIAFQSVSASVCVCVCLCGCVCVCLCVSVSVCVSAWLAEGWALRVQLPIRPMATWGHTSATRCMSCRVCFHLCAVCVFHFQRVFI